MNTSEVQYAEQPYDDGHYVLVETQDTWTGSAQVLIKSFVCCTYNPMVSKWIVVLTQSQEVRFRI